MKIGHKLRRLRIDSGNPSKAEVARRAGTTGQTLGQIEAGNRSQPSIPVLLGLARYYQVPLEWLLDDKADFPPPANMEHEILSIVRDALANAGYLGDLSPQEREILARYRATDESGRGELLGYVRRLPIRDDTEAQRDALEASIRSRVDQMDRQTQARSSHPTHRERRAGGS